MKQESVEYYRQRARAECEAALNATCGVARKAHAEMAHAYDRLVQLGEMEASGALDPGKVASFADAVHDREQSEYGGHAPAPTAASD